MSEIIPRFRRAADGYVLELTDLGTEFRVDRLRRERNELVAELTVASNLPGARSTNGILSAADFNLSSIRARSERARHLAERSNAPTIDWTGLLEELCQSVIAAERTGQPAQLLRDLPRPPADDGLRVDGLVLPRRHPSVLFGDGGDAKSYLALFLATRMAADGIRVLYADWEFSGTDHRDRLERLTGSDMPDILYIRCERPMVAESDRLRRIVREEHVDYLVADSVAFAADGPPEAAEVASRYFGALRQIGIGSLNVAHVTKSEQGEHKPFGSTFWHNGARSTWFAKRSAESRDAATITVGIFNRKANLGPLAAPFGYSITFDPDRTVIERCALDDAADLVDRMTLRERMVRLLAAQGAMTMAAIASDLETKVDSVVKTVKRGEGSAFVRVPGADGVYRIGLLVRNAA